MADEPKKLSITLPPKNGTGPRETFTDLTSLVLVGPNGSGKSKLGFWIDTHQASPTQAHRIAAQRALGISKTIEPQGYEHAELGVLYGGQPAAQKAKWRDIETAILVNDFDELLKLLFAEQAKVYKEHGEKTKRTGAYEPVPESRIEQLLRIWKELFPQRELRLQDDQVKVSGGGQEYYGTYMSDGEKVALYLIGQCLCAPKNSIIVVDEPELHLHKAILGALWDRIEAARSDCLLVYITHDLDFAASRTSAKKIHVKEYNGTTWIWEDVNAIDTLPEDVLLQIMGSRRKILFVEGDKGSLDFAIYGAVYPNRLVVPRGSCHRVVEATKALRSLRSFHYLDVRGIIDRDYRSDKEIAVLRNRGVDCLEVSEVENLLCTEEVVKIVARAQLLDPGETVNKVRDFIFDEFKKETELQTALRVNAQLKSAFGKFDASGHSGDEVASALKKCVAAIDYAGLWESSSNLYQHIIREENYADLLKHYNRKGLSDRISSCFGMNDYKYPEYVLRKLNVEAEELRRAKQAPAESEDTLQQADVDKEGSGAPALILNALKAHLPQLDEDQ